MSEQEENLIQTPHFSSKETEVQTHEESPRKMSGREENNSRSLSLSSIFLQLYQHKLNFVKH